MAYCAVTDIEELLGNDYDEYTKPTSDEVDALCEACAVEYINPMIEQYLPVDESDEVAQGALSGISRFWVAAQVCFMDVRLETLGEKYLRQAEDRMKALLNNPGVLTGSTASILSPSGSTRATSRFKRDTQQW